MKTPFRPKIGFGVVKTFANDAAFTAFTGSSPVTADTYFNSTEGVYRTFNGVSWISTAKPSNRAVVRLYDDSTVITPSGNVTIDGVLTAANDLVLMAAHGTIKGIYQVNAGLWTLVTDKLQNLTGAPTIGDLVFINAGTVNALTSKIFNGTAWVNEIPDASTTVRGLISTLVQSLAGTKTFTDGISAEEFLKLEPEDNTDTGASVTLTAPTQPVVRLTSSIVDIIGMDATTGDNSAVLLVNNSGADINIPHDADGSDGFFTGGDTFLFKNETAVIAYRDAGLSRWLLIGGAGGGGAVTYTAFTLANNQAAPANVTDLILDKNITTAAGVEYSINRSTSSSALDTTFNTNMGTKFADTTWASFEQSDNKILVGGDFNSFNSNVAKKLARIDSSGAADSTFNTALGTGFNSTVETVKKRTSDGLILVGGAFTSLNGVTADNVKRFTALTDAGAIDGTFTFGTGFNNLVQIIEIQADNKILVGGYFTDRDGATRNRLLRMNSNGTDDGAFYTNLGAGFNAEIRAIKEQSDNKILVGGNFTQLNAVTKNRLVRLNSDGTQDAAFYTNLGTGFSGGAIFAIDIQTDGKILVGGLFNSFNGSTRRGLVRLNSDGTEDTAFYTNLGAAFQFSGGDGQVRAVKVLTTGKIVVGGFFNEFNTITREGLVRLKTDGTEDSTFYTNLTPFSTAQQFNHITQLASGNIIVGGFNNTISSTASRLHKLNLSLTDLVEKGKIECYYKKSTSLWYLDNSFYVGDAAGITFSITSSGQIRYTSTNLTGGIEDNALRYLITLL